MSLNHSTVVSNTMGAIRDELWMGDEYGLSVAPAAGGGLAFHSFPDTKEPFDYSFTPMKDDEFQARMGNSYFPYTEALQSNSLSPVESVSSGSDDVTANGVSAAEMSKWDAPFENLYNEEYPAPSYTYYQKDGKSPAITAFPLPPELSFGGSQSRSRRGSDSSSSSEETPEPTTEEPQQCSPPNSAKPTGDVDEKPKRKRGRKKSNISEIERRTRRLERGRVAANKCRRRKREMESEMQSKAHELQHDNKRKYDMILELREELKMLKMALKRHDGSLSPCVGIPEAKEVHMDDDPGLEPTLELLRADLDGVV